MAVYRTGLSKNEVTEGALAKSGLNWKKVNPREKIMEVAPTLIGVPYKFGASVLNDSPNAFDCSSMIAYLYALAGFSVSRICDDQYQSSREISEADARPGDLVFFKGNRDDISSDKVGHVGLYIGGGQMIQAGGVKIGYGKVVKEKITESKYYPTGFLGYRQLLPNDEERYAIEIPGDRIDLRNRENLIKEINQHA